MEKNFINNDLQRLIESMIPNDSAERNHAVAGLRSIHERGDVDRVGIVLGEANPRHVDDRVRRARINQQNPADIGALHRRGDERRHQSERQGEDVRRETRGIGLKTLDIRHLKLSNFPNFQTLSLLDHDLEVLQRGGIEFAVEG